MYWTLVILFGVLGWTISLPLQVVFVNVLFFLDPCDQCFWFWTLLALLFFFLYVTFLLHFVCVCISGILRIIWFVPNCYIGLPSCFLKAKRVQGGLYKGICCCPVDSYLPALVMWEIGCKRLLTRSQAKDSTTDKDEIPDDKSTSEEQGYCDYYLPQLTGYPLTVRTKPTQSEVWHQQGRGVPETLPSADPIVVKAIGEFKDEMMQEERKGSSGRGMDQICWASNRKMLEQRCQTSWSWSTGSPWTGPKSIAGVSGEMD